MSFSQIIFHIVFYVFLVIEFGEGNQQKIEGGGERIKKFELYTLLYTPGEYEKQNLFL